MNVPVEFSKLYLERAGIAYHCRISRTIVHALVAVLLAASAFADDVINADRPGIADGSSTVDRSVLQIEAGGERDDVPDGTHALFTPALFRYGIAEGIELRVEGSGYMRASGESGWTPLSIGTKVHFLEEDAAHHRPSLGVIARVFVPSGSGAFRSTTTDADVRLAADLDLSERWAINPNIGIHSQHDGGGRFTAGLAALTIQYNFSPRLNAFVDGGLQAPEARGGTSSLLLDSGVAWIIGRDTQFDGSIGWGAHGSAPRVFWSAGVSRRF